MFHMLSHRHEYHPSCLENLSQAFAQFDRPSELISTTFNIFMNYQIDLNGKIHLRRPISKPGDCIVFRALEDFIVGLTACADQATNGGFASRWNILSHNQKPGKLRHNESVLFLRILSYQCSFGVGVKIPFSALTVMSAAYNDDRPS